MRPLAESSQTPMISLAANQAIVDGSEWVFKTAQNDRVVIERMIGYMEQQGFTTIGLARDASGFGEGVQEMFDEIGADAGISVVATEKFAPDATDFTAQMVNLRDAAATSTSSGASRRRPVWPRRPTGSSGSRRRSCRATASATRSSWTPPARRPTA
jgi:hypothetical protein